LFTSGSRQLHLWLQGSVSFGKLLCELAFGGFGKAAFDIDPNALPVKIEQRLANHMLKQVSSGFSKVLAEAADCDFSQVSEPDPEKLEQFTAPQRLIEVQLAITVLQGACEVTAYFVADEIKDLLLEKPTVKRHVSPYESVKKCKFELRSLLPPDEVSLATVLSLRPGSQLSLSLTVDSPIVVVCGDSPVFEGECDPSGDRINIHLSSRDGAPDPQIDEILPAASGSFH
jgi:flagellar motor switch protein FliM